MAFYRGVGGSSQAIPAFGISDLVNTATDQSIYGNKTFKSAILGNLLGNASTASSVPYSGLTGTVPTWNQNTTGNAATVTNGVYLTAVQTLLNKTIDVGQNTLVGVVTPDAQQTLNNKVISGGVY
jgi:hypothetical protein